MRTCYKIKTILHKIHIKKCQLVQAYPLIMKNIYLFLTDNDKQALFKLAQQKQLSISTTTQIITEYFLYYTLTLTEYKNRGQNMIHLHIETKYSKLESINNLTSINFNNAIWMYLHHEEIKNEKTLKETLTDKKYRIIKANITKELNNRYDPKFNQNMIIRTAYQIEKRRKHYEN